MVQCIRRLKCELLEPRQLMHGACIDWLTADQPLSRDLWDQLATTCHQQEQFRFTQPSDRCADAWSGDSGTAAAPAPVTQDAANSAAIDEISADFVHREESDQDAFTRGKDQWTLKGTVGLAYCLASTLFPQFTPRFGVQIHREEKRRDLCRGHHLQSENRRRSCGVRPS